MAVLQLDGEQPEFPADGLYWVAETAVVIGRVRLKSEASVWWGAVLRGDNEWIEVGGGAQRRGSCTIGDHSLIARGAILLNGARIGAHCIVGAGALVTEGKSFPDHSLIVGAPARVSRTLDDKAAAQIAAGG